MLSDRDIKRVTFINDDLLEYNRMCRGSDLCVICTGPLERLCIACSNFVSTDLSTHLYCNNSPAVVQTHLNSLFKDRTSLIYGMPYELRKYIVDITPQTISAPVCGITKGMCNHTFHSHCMDRWLHRRPRCPLCNTNWVVKYCCKEELFEETFKIEIK